MEKYIDFLQKNKYGNLATTQGNQPYVRPFEFGFKSKDGLFFYTSDEKKVFEQIKINPKISFCAIDQNHNYVELIGKATFSEDINHKKRMLTESKYAKKIYQNEDNPHFRVFYMDHGKAIYHDNVHNSSEKFQF